MKITAIKPRRGHLAAILCENREEPFLLDLTLSQESLCVGMELSEEELSALSEESTRRRAVDRALYQLGFRDHGEQELLQKLTRSFPRPAAEAAVARMKELGLVDDLRFARLFARDRIVTRGYALPRIRQELLKKGVQRDAVEQALRELKEETDTVGQIEEILSRRFSPLPTDEKGKRRMMNYLLSRGYRYHEIRDALERRGDAWQESEEEE